MKMHNKFAELEESGDSVYDGDLELWSYKYPLPEHITEILGSVYLTNEFTLDNPSYGFSLPRTLEYIQGDLVLGTYKHKLPLGLKKIGGALLLNGYRIPLPARLSEIGGYLNLSGYEYPLPAGLKSVGGTLFLGDYKYPLPAGLKSVGGGLDLRGYSHPLPAELKSVGALILEGYDHPLPAGLRSVGGYLVLAGYPHPLPAGLTSVGESLSLKNYDHPLPAGLTSVGGNLDLRGYSHLLPAGLTSVGGGLWLEDYPHPLPAGLTSVGGHLNPSNYKHPLPAGLKSVGGSLWLDGYNHPLPAGLTSVGGSLDLSNYKHPLPAGLKSVGGKIQFGDYSHPLPACLAGNYEFDGETWKVKPLRDHYTARTPQTSGFQSWFEGSKAADPDGSPKVLYHGTRAGGFTKFDRSKTDAHHPGFYFSDNLEVANSYSGIENPRIVDPLEHVTSDPSWTGSGIYRVYLQLKNSLVIDAEGANWDDITNHPFGRLRRTYEIAAEAARRGYDGVIFKNLYDTGHWGDRLTPLSDVYIVFSPNQVKSALFNSGEYSLTDDDIRKNPRKTSRRPARRTSKRARKTSRR